MNTTFWASLDQYTSFEKDLWRVGRPENRKDNSFLSKATFAEWPNTTCDFSRQHGVAPPGKLAIRNLRDFATDETAVPKEPAAHVLHAAGSTRSTTNNAKAASSTRGQSGRLALPTQQELVTPVIDTETRDKADNTFAAYTLKSHRCIPDSASVLPSVSSKRTIINPVPTSKWSAINIGFSETAGEARAFRKRHNREGYMKAASAAQEADKPYIAEAARFRFKYPHTFGQISALSHARHDRERGNTLVKT